MAILATLPNFILYFTSSVLLSLLFLAIYIKLTPYNEFSLIKQGVIAPAISLSGAMLGFVIALASVIKNSLDFLDMAVWGFIAMIVQLIAFVIVRLLFKTLTEGINNNNIAKAIFLAMMSLLFGLLNAACMTY